jgi:hypothetical protein
MLLGTVLDCDVEDALRARLDRLAAIHRNAHAIGQFKADVLDKMTEPGAFAKAFDERSRYPLAQWCSYIPGRAASKRSMNPGIS